MTAERALLSEVIKLPRWKGMRVYFIRAQTSGNIKIGWSYNPAARLRDLQVGSPEPLELEAEIEAGPRAESRLHSHFAGDRLHGEWFRSSDALRGFIAACQTLEPLPPVRRVRA